MQNAPECGDFVGGAAEFAGGHAPCGAAPLDQSQQRRGLDLQQQCDAKHALVSDQSDLEAFARARRRNQGDKPVDGNAAELAVVASVLVGAIAEGGARAREFGTDAQFREIVRQAREIHDLLIEALIENEPLSTETLRGVVNTMDNSIDELEALAELPDEMVG